MLVRETVHVHQRTAYGKLPRFVDIVRASETLLHQPLLQSPDVLHVAHRQSNGMVLQLTLAHHQFRQSLGIGDDEEGSTPLQRRQGIRAQDLVASITLAVLHGTAETAWQEEHLAGAQYLCQVMIEVSRLLLIVHDEEVGVGEHLGAFLR